jgi:hypothetical protein
MNHGDAPSVSPQAMIAAMRMVPLFALLLAAACVSSPPPRPPPPPPARDPAPPAAPPAARPSIIPEAEAVRIAASFARSRGLSVQRYKAKLLGNEQWQVDLRAQRGVDRAKVLIDARDGRVLRAKLRRDDPDW